MAKARDFEFSTLVEHVKCQLPDDRELSSWAMSWSRNPVKMLGLSPSKTFLIWFANCL